MTPVEKAVAAVEAFCGADKMSKEAAQNFLYEVISRLHTSIEALGDEIADEDC
jgi:hypothetical protein